MVRIRSYEEYTELVNGMIQSCPSYVTNSYLMKDNVIRLINHKRLFFEKTDGGIILYDDEVNYYQCYVYWDTQSDINIPVKDKLAVYMNISLDGYANEGQEALKKKLLKMGFNMDAKLRQVIGNPEEVLNNIKDDYKFAEGLFYRNGYHLAKPTNDNIKGIRKVLGSMETIPIYQMPYLTDEEFVAEGEQGKQICVTDQHSNVVAVAGSNHDKGSTSYIGILKEHRMSSGIAIVLSEKILSYCLTQKLKNNGWIDETNTASIVYHHSIGFKWGNRIMEYFVR